MMRRARAVYQHHDGITGTERNHVFEDYESRLSLGFASISDTTASLTSRLIAAGSNESKAPALTTDENFPFKTLGSKSVAVIVQNSLSWRVKRYVSAIVPTSNVRVLGEDKNTVPYQVRK